MCKCRLYVISRGKMKLFKELTHINCDVKLNLQLARVSILNTTLGKDHRIYQKCSCCRVTWI